MGRVVNIERAKMLRLAAEIEPVLQHTAVVEAVEKVDVETFRKAARHLGRVNKWRVRTGVSHGRVWACRDDLEVSEYEKQEAGRLVTDLLLHGEPPKVTR
jgi:hypothetical protein